MEMVEKKEIIHEDCHKNYATRGIGNTALRFGIAGTALGLLSMGGRGLFGLGGNSVTTVEILSGPSAFQAWQHSCDAELADQKALYEFTILSGNARFNDRQIINNEMFGLYKSQIDADFNLYKN